MASGLSVVIPTVGRPSLAHLWAALGGQPSPPVPLEVLLVDDRRAPATPRSPLPLPSLPGVDVRVLAGPGAGPSAARNRGWRAARHEWVAFLDDDVVPQPGWLTQLVRDLAVPAQVAGVQGRVQVPLPAGVRPTDWQRCTANLAQARWITADMAYRRSVLAAVGGFDERFPRAYREDAELAHRVGAAGWRLVRGCRRVWHPVRPEGPLVSVRMQRGNTDDALLRRIYGRRWRSVLELPRGRRSSHVAVTVAGVVAALTAPARVPAARAVRAVAAGVWLAGTVEFCLARVRPGPRTPPEVATMVLTSVLIPPMATVAWLRGWWSHRAAEPWPAGAAAPS